MATQNVKTITAVELPPNAHSKLIQLANLKGTPLKIFAGQLIADYLTILEQDEIKNNPTIRSREIFYKAELAQERYANARQIAAAYQENPTIENAELFESYCETAGLNPETFISSLPAYDPFASILAAEVKGKAFKQAVVFLADAFAKANGQPIPTNEIIKRAEDLGIGPRTIDRAKAYINKSEQTQIVAVRTGKTWAWMVADPTQPEPDLPDLPQLED